MSTSPSQSTEKPQTVFVLKHGPDVMGVFTTRDAAKAANAQMRCCTAAETAILDMEVEKPKPPAFYSIVNDAGNPIDEGKVTIGKANDFRPNKNGPGYVGIGYGKTAQEARVAAENQVVEGLRRMLTSANRIVGDRRWTTPMTREEVWYPFPVVKF